MKLPWSEIDRVFLDMDGALLDLHFDNHFWLEHVPRRYAESNGLSLDAAKNELLPRYRQAEGSLDWYCVDYWSRELQLDIALLKEEVEHLIAVHPHVLNFLDALRQLEKRVVLVTNAHTKSLDIKMRKTRLDGHLDAIISSHDLGLPKEDPAFWQRLHAVEPYANDRTLFVDDSLPVLESARAHGIVHLLAITNADSKGPPRDSGDFPAIANFAELLPLGNSAPHR